MRLSWPVQSCALIRTIVTLSFVLARTPAAQNTRGLSINPPAGLVSTHRLKVPIGIRIQCRDNGRNGL